MSERRRLPVIDQRAGDRVEADVTAKGNGQVSRRGFLASAAATAAAASATSGCGDINTEKFFQKHYKELSPEDKVKVFERIEAETKKRTGRNVTVSDPEPEDDVSFVFCISLSACNGNRKCVEACVKENNQSRDPAIQYIRVLEMPRGTLNLELGDQYYEGEVPKKDKYYLPMQCNQCDNPPCVKACPIEATWKQKDGIVVIDYDWCIGCRYCMAACPYEARRFNYDTPKLQRAQINADQGYLSNRLRPRGVVEKCHFCLHRTRRGSYPACMEACPTGARKFGNILDPNSEVAAILREKRVFALREDLGTIPRLYYYFD